MASGTVTWFNASKGYGFIKPADGTTAVFVQFAEVQRAGLKGLSDGQQVSYDTVIVRGNRAATNLSLA